MNRKNQELIDIGLIFAIVIASLYVIHEFIPSLIWAGIIVMTSFPLYVRWRSLLKSWENTAAFTFTLALFLLLLLPLSYVLTIIIKESQLFWSYIQEINESGKDAPTFFQELPMIGDHMVTYWDAHIGQPGNVKTVLSDLSSTASRSTGNFLKTVGGSLVHRSMQIGFTLLSVFFLYRDGESLAKQIQQVSHTLLGERWRDAMKKIPFSLRATVNGTIVVGIGVGFLMGLCYGLLGVPAPTLMGVFTALAAMIPFVVPLVFGMVALILLIHGAMISAIIVIIWGTVVMFTADHFIKPILIGGATQLPFLAVLFSILGGLNTMGILGLFVGPVLMVLFITLWNELQSMKSNKIL